MPQNDSTLELLDILGIAPSRPMTAGTTFLGSPGLREHQAAPRAVEPAPFSLATIAEMKQLLRTDPAVMLATAPALLGQSPTVGRAQALLDDAEMALRRPELTLAIVRSNRAADPFELPPEHRFEGYDTTEIPIVPDETKFEERADAAAWALTAVAAWAFRLTHRKASFIGHTSSPTAFVYPLVTANGDATVALFSDWGTGYYHSQYIAKHIGRMEPGQAVHLGDVYYTGTAAEFDERFIPPLERYLAATVPLYTLNANHEMDTHGLAYFDYLARRRRPNGPAASIHRQEGSYFCLRSDRYQVVGIDTAFDRNGRLSDGEQKNWLQARLSEGKSAGRINILLSQNEPFEKAPQKLLTKDLRTLVDQGMVDLWFWGDQHYCALYPPGPSTPFGGSCIGHGGYPYRVKDEADFAEHLVAPLFGELETRFPAELDVRPGLGNNGFCFLTLANSSVEIRYVDWRSRERFRIVLPIESGRLRWPNQ